MVKMDGPIIRASGKLWPLYLTSIFVFTGNCGTKSGTKPNQGTDLGAEVLPDIVKQELPGELNADQVNGFTSKINLFRSESRLCGSEQMAIAPAVEWNQQLYQAAARHSADMSQTQQFSHTGSDGSSPFDRIKDHDYSFRIAAENIAGGMSDEDSVLTAWENSPGHCRNMMNNQVVHYGLANREGYWTLVLAAPI